MNLKEAIEKVKKEQDDFSKDRLVAKIVSDSFGLRKQAVLKWMESKGYTHKDFKKIIKEAKNLVKFIEGILKSQEAWYERINLQTKKIVR